MTISIHNIEDLLRESRPEDPLQIASLRILDPGDAFFHTVLVQPRGLIEANSERIGPHDRRRAQDASHRALRLAIDNGADLFVAPEYFCPWNVIEEIVSDSSLRPAQGALWVLGCESIKPGDLDALATRSSTSTLRFIYEEIDAPERRQRTFVDPVVYVFWARSASQEPVLCFVVQFKTTPCGDLTEQRSMCRGSRVYRFGDSRNAISLITFICSDAFSVTDEIVDLNYRNTFFIHVQLNEKPWHDDYVRFRRRIFSKGSDDHVEILALNWGSGLSTTDGESPSKPWDTTASSTWFVPAHKFKKNGQDPAIEDAHARGLYYARPQVGWDAFVINHQEGMILLNKSRLFQNAPRSVVKNVPPEVRKYWVWSDEAHQWQECTPDDGFAAALRPYPALQTALAGLTLRPRLDVERSLELLCFPQGPPRTWYQSGELRALSLAEGESIRRVTVVQEHGGERAGVRERGDRLRKAQGAATLQGCGVPWTPPLSDLETGVNFIWDRTSPHQNVASISSGEAATLINLGDEPGDDVVSNVYDKIRKAIRMHDAEVGCDDAVTNRRIDRICIVYRQSNRVHVHRPANLITSPSDQSGVDIAEASP